MSTEEQYGSFGDFVNRINKCHPRAGESIDNMLVMDDFVIDKDVAAKYPQRFFQTRNRHIDAGAESSGVRKQDFHRGTFALPLVFKTLPGSKESIEPHWIVMSHHSEAN